MVCKLNLVEKSVGPHRGTHDGAFDARDAQTFRVSAQILRDQRGIEVQRIAQARGLTARVGIGKAKLSLIAERCTQTEIIEPKREARRPRLVPAMVEWSPRPRQPCRSPGIRSR